MWRKNAYIPEVQYYDTIYYVMMDLFPYNELRKERLWFAHNWGLKLILMQGQRS